MMTMTRFFIAVLLVGVAAAAAQQEYGGKFVLLSLCNNTKD